MQLTDGCKGIILQFTVIKNYHLVFDYTVHYPSICLKYEYGLPGTPVRGTIHFWHLKDNSDIRQNQESLVHKIASFIINTAEDHSYISWSKNKKCFYNGMNPIKTYLPDYLNDIIFKLIKFFSKKVKSRETKIKKLEDFEQKLRNKGVKIEVIRPKKRKSDDRSEENDGEEEDDDRSEENEGEEEDV